jgi:hypothetical protein
MFILLRDLVPSLAVLNVFALTTPQFDGQHWTLPIEMLKAQLPLAAVLLGVAYLMFIGVGDRLMKGYDKMRETRVGSAALIVCGILAALLGSSVVGWVVLTDPSSDDYDVPAARYVSWTTTRARTRYYSFVYPTNLADRARHLLERADDVHNVVTTFLESEPDSGQIAVDMSSSIARHAGQAYWKAIRLDLLATDNPEVLRGVLGHETTHVIADRVSNSRLTDAFNSIRFFHEGLATYVEHELFGSYETLAPLRAVAATMRHRHLVRFDELVENDRFCRTHDTHLVYPLGEVFVASIVATYGKAAPAALLRSFGRKDAPEGLTGMELWQDTFQATGYNLDQVIDNFYARLDALVDEHRGFVESMPRPRGAVRFESNRVGVQVLADLSDGWGPVCRFRQDMDDPDYQYMYGIEGDSHTFWLDQADLPGATFWYQVGLKETSGDRVIFEPWQQVRKKR